MYHIKLIINIGHTGFLNLLTKEKAMWTVKDY